MTNTSLRLDHTITVLKGMGPKTTDIFKKHGIHTLEDLLYFFPRAWINATEVSLIKDIRPGSQALLQVQVSTVQEGYSQRTRKPYLRATVSDISGSVDVMWFHARYLKHKIKPGVPLLLYGKLQGWRAQDQIIMSPKFIAKPCIIPVYPAIGGLASRTIHALTLQTLPLIESVEDYLPEPIRSEHAIPSLSETLRSMHAPNTIGEINRARLRLGFDEILMLMVPSLLSHNQRQQEHLAPYPVQSTIINEWCNALPFELTDGQKSAIYDILHDFTNPQPMNRLIQGDVGSGKTVVGLVAALHMLLSNKQIAWLAPTELLAQQHFETATQHFRNSNVTRHIPIGLWTRSQHYVSYKDERVKSSIEEVMRQPFIIGTHALLSEKVQFNNLSLLIIDEQHRFGVNQRAKLRLFEGKPIHLLSMTATPIPRTMALVLYGDLQLSTIKHKPAGRKPITTRVVEENNREKAFRFIEAHIKNGHQVYVVCPTIEPSKDEEANIFNQLFEQIEEKKAVITYYKNLSEQFPHFRIGLLHGKLKAKEKERVMSDFRSGTIDILISTTVIEVGVDVPNATIMVIEDADRFGLAQLHQLRGRVGRSDRQSFCLLFSSHGGDSTTERLKTMEETNDGFVLAEKDLELRGPGEITGLAQSGIPPLRFASLQDVKRIDLVREVARELIENPLFQQSLERFWRAHHPE